MAFTFILIRFFPMVTSLFRGRDGAKLGKFLFWQQAWRETRTFHSYSI
ncbi:hypothetical protein OPIT5_29845 [Opitutaceae bacterium TAV5]|nr:hypothetical protein OPIT5_29845 [Opitutaceae bacterium TAV5]